MELKESMFNISPLYSDNIFEDLLKKHSTSERIRLLTELDNFYRKFFKIPYIRTLIIHDATDEWLSPMIMMQDEEADKFQQDIEDKIFQRGKKAKRPDLTRLNLTISFDERLLTGDINIKLIPREFTAIYLHEIGHILSYEDYLDDMASLLNRELAKFGLDIKDRKSENFIKKWIRDKLASFYSTKHAWYLTMLKEMKSDDVAVRYGYGSDLVNGLNKIFNYLNRTYKGQTSTLMYFDKMKTDRFKSIESTMKDELTKCKTKEEFDYLSKQYNEIVKINNK